MSGALVAALPPLPPYPGRRATHADHAAWRAQLELYRAAQQPQTKEH